MPASQGIGLVRNQLFRRALAVQRVRRAPARARHRRAEVPLLRELLDEAHARIRTLEKAVERLAAAAG